MRDQDGHWHERIGPNEWRVYFQKHTPPRHYFTVPEPARWYIMRDGVGAVEFVPNQIPMPEWFKAPDLSKGTPSMTEDEYCDATALATVRAMKVMAHGLNIFEGENEARRVAILAALREIEADFEAKIKVT